MPAKTPIYLKTSTQKRGKKLKLRDVLSNDMISRPLGDVRHSAHVGPEGEGDMFGDVGFLHGKLDMLPGLSRARSRSVERRLEEAFSAEAESLHNSFHHHHHRRNPLHTTLLKSTVSMPVFIAPEQPPPKPPRLHLEEQQRSVSVGEGGVGRYGDPCHDLNLSASIPALRHLVPSAGSSSEASSEDSMLEVCGPLDPRRGLSLDSDAGLSDEDLRSERSSESPVISPGVSHSESLAGLDLDLGPSILEDVLRIMDRYKSAEDGCEL